MTETRSFLGGRPLTSPSSDASTKEALGRESIAALRQSGRLLEAAFTENPLPIIVSTLDDSVVVDINRAFLAYLGRERDEVVGRSSFELGLWPDVESRNELLAELRRKGSVRRFPFSWTGPSGTSFDFLLSCNLIEVRGRTCLVTAAEDVTELNRVRREVEESEQRFSLAFRYNPAALSISRIADGVFVDVNETFAELVGVARDGLVGRSSAELGLWPDAEERRRAFEPILRDGFARRVPASVVSASGELRQARISGMTFDLNGEQCILIQAEDVTDLHRAEEERKRLEADFHRGQRLESLGLLAGGVAHDFNNLLTAILGYSELATRRLPAGSSAAKPLRELRDAAGRAAELTQKMLAFAGGGALEVEWVSLNEIVEEMVDLARPSLPAGRSLALELARPAPGVEADATQIRQLAINLLLNASEAIEGDGGTIGVATGEISCERERLAAAVHGAEAPEGRYAFLSVSDDGAGIAPEVRDRIFEPFFTTKFTGRGLGLAAVLGIVRAHRGAIELESGSGHGTRITVLLPIARPPA